MNHDHIQNTTYSHCIDTTTAAGTVVLEEMTHKNNTHLAFGYRMEARTGMFMQNKYLRIRGDYVHTVPIPKSAIGMGTEIHMN